MNSESRKAGKTPRVHIRFTTLCLPGKYVARASVLRIVRALDHSIFNPI
jgi:hypothetical protein